MRRAPYLAIPLAMAVFALAGCVNAKADSINAVEAYGFTGVSIEGRAWWGCGDSDAYGYRFTATNVAGRKVNGVVCGGIAKGSTVRIMGVDQ